MNTLVSVIALCHNHAPYVEECLRSVWVQTYPFIELIVVDDASTDGSKGLIASILKGHPEVPFISLDSNEGNCRAFNRGLALAKGKYVIDLAADDVLLPERIAQQTALLDASGADYGVAFSDALLIQADGTPLRTFYRRDAQGKLLQPPPQGDVYAHLIRQAFICTPTMLMRRDMLLSLGGYDESLSYEDYDFWVRSGRTWKYAFQEEVLTHKRVLPRSLGQGFYQKGDNPHLRSTLVVCRKAQALNQTEAEHKALAHSVRYHLRQSIFHSCYALALEYMQLLQEIDALSWKDQCWKLAARLKLPLWRLYQWYLRR